MSTGTKRRMAMTYSKCLAEPAQSRCSVAKLPSQSATACRLRFEPPGLRFKRRATGSSSTARRNVSLTKISSGRSAKSDVAVPRAAPSLVVSASDAEPYREFPPGLRRRGRSWIRANARVSFGQADAESILPPNPPVHCASLTTRAKPRARTAQNAKFRKLRGARLTGWSRVCRYLQQNGKSRCFNGRNVGGQAWKQR